MAYKSRIENAKLSSREIITKDDAGKTKEKIKYDTIEYPINQLGSSRYPHYTIFYLNEIEKSTAEKQKFTSSQPKEKKTAGASTSATLKKVEGTLAETIATAVDMLGIGDKQSVKDNLQFTAQRKRLKLAICLPMPAKVRANYNAGYSETSEVNGMGATILAALGGSGDATKTALFAVAPTAVSTTIKAATPRFASGIIEPPSPETLKQIVSKLSGRVLNKRQEQIFNNMKFRTHQFSYLFIPRNKEESENITTILQAFKEYMHPSLEGGAGSSLLITPAEFDIEFRSNETENKTLHRIATCALESMDVNYTAIGEFIAFEGTDSPVAISLDMTFIEMEPLTREMIRLGF